MLSRYKKSRVFDVLVVCLSIFMLVMLFFIHRAGLAGATDVSEMEYSKEIEQKMSYIAVRLV